MMHIGFQCSRAIDVHQIGEGKFTIVDAFGTSTIPFSASCFDELTSELRSRANVVPLTRADGRLLLPENNPLDGSQIPWSIEEPYVARIPDLYRAWLCGSGDRDLFDASRTLLPIVYAEAGWGHSSKVLFEQIHKSILDGSWSGSTVVTKEMLLAYMHHGQIERICDDIVALISRAVISFQRLLTGLRRVVREQGPAIERLGVSEVIHSGPLSHQIASDATIAVVSATSSLELVTKLVSFVNETRLPQNSVGARGKQFCELSRLKPNSLTQPVLTAIADVYSSKPFIPEMIQFRHDIIHSTTAIELERTLYVGRETPAINCLPMYYAELPWRDIEPGGQPHRFLGRDYFTSQGRNFDQSLHSWLCDVVKAHAEAARILIAFLVQDHVKSRLRST